MLLETEGRLDEAAAYLDQAASIAAEPTVSPQMHAGKRR